MVATSTRRGLAVLTAGILACAAVRPSLAVAAQDPSITVDVITRRAGEYVVRFVEQFSNVVTEERYVQDIAGSASSGVRRGAHRELRSDLLLIRMGGILEWRPFRDVFEVNGAPVRDRDERLTRLFVKPSVFALEEAETIATESARFNIGAVMRTVNTPVHTLLLLQPSLQTHFQFSLEKIDRGLGPRMWIVAFEEHARPTLIRGDGDSDLPATGRFWIDADTGVVARTELVVYGGRVTAVVTTEFREDSELGIAVPTEMREDYRLQPGRVTATATYGRFRRFEVSTQTDVAPEPR